MPLYNANDINPLNEFWDFLNRQFSGEFKLGTFVKAVSDVANSASAVATASLPLAGGTMTGDIVLDGAGIDSAAAVDVGTSTATGVNVGTAVGCAVSIGEVTGTASFNCVASGVNGVAAADLATVGQTLGGFNHFSVAVGVEAAAKRVITGSIVDMMGGALVGAMNVTLKIYSTAVPTIVANAAGGGTAVLQELGIGGSTKASFHTFQTAGDGTFVVEITVGAPVADMNLEFVALEALPYVTLTSFAGP